MKSPIRPKSSRGGPKPRTSKAPTSHRTRSSDHADQRELLYYGVHMCEALSRVRREAIIRVYCTDQTSRALGPLLKWCAQRKKAYHLVTEAELERITGSVHHEGVAILALVPEPWSEEALLAALKLRVAPLLVLDGVQNPHNIGTIMRVMANFSWPFLVGGSDLPNLTAAGARMSEGGAEFVKLVRCQNLPRLIGALKRSSYRILGTSSHAEASLYTHQLPERTAFILGSEVHGMSQEMEKLLDETLVIPGSGQVESLNVAVASGLLLGEYTRVYGLLGEP